MIDFVLVPKVKNPLYPKDFRPISVCNSIYKIIPKALSNRISLAFPSFITKNQPSFVKGHPINNIAMLGTNIMHHIYSKKSTNNMALKLHMAEAFDRVHSSYLEYMLTKFQFPTSTIQILMKCVTTTSIVFHNNGNRIPHFQPSKGLRQENPLSYLLFVLFMENLSALIHKASMLGRWKHISLR